MEDCSSVAIPLHTNLAHHVKKNKTNSAGFPALGIQSGHVLFKILKKIKSIKFGELLTGDPVTCDNCLHSSA